MDQARRALAAIIRDAVREALAPPVEEWIDCHPVDRSGDPVQVFGAAGKDSLGESFVQFKKRINQ